MNIIIPMAGIGKRMRPHTLTVPKPLLPIAGKPIVQRLVEDIAKILHEKIDSVGFVVSPHFGKDVEADLIKIAASVGASGKIYYQEEAHGTAHAIICAEELLTDHVVIAFADTLFRAHFSLDSDKDGIIWVQKVEDPAAFGVVKVNEDDIITDFVEKPDAFVSDLAIIGIYYFKNGDVLRDEINYVIDNDIKDKGEYQLTSALENMKAKGARFTPGQVDNWLDCGNKDVTVNTNKQYLEFIREEKLVADTATIENSALIPPVFIGENVNIVNSVIGPYVSIVDESQIMDYSIKNCIIQTHTSVKEANLENSMLGNFVNFEDTPEDLSLGDYSSRKRFR
jgi:glucose-1-phosphate thymidylyltransferase